MAQEYPAGTRRTYFMCQAVPQLHLALQTPLPALQVDLKSSCPMSMPTSPINMTQELPKPENSKQTPMIADEIMIHTLLLVQRFLNA